MTDSSMRDMLISQVCDYLIPYLDGLEWKPEPEPDPEDALVPWLAFCEEPDFVSLDGRSTHEQIEAISFSYGYWRGVCDGFNVTTRELADEHGLTTYTGGE
jgi:hypothetical protein